MRYKFELLLLIFVVQSGFSQDTIRSLIISEARLNPANLMYIELTNRGDSPVQLNQFEIGSLNSQGTPFEASPGHYTRLPEKLLQPGECYILCNINDYGPEENPNGPFPAERYNKPELLQIADFMVHIGESNPLAKSDSITEGIKGIFHVWGKSCIYIEQHFPSGDSVVIDQVNGIFNGNDEAGGYAVAGVPQASSIATLIRKYKIKTGNPDFDSARGLGANDSEWIVVPNSGDARGFDAWRKIFWTVGNHVNATLDDNTLESEIASVDFTAKTITVPWGTLRADDIMNYFVKKPGIVWNYHCNPNPEDSLNQAAKTGDKLELFVCGNEVEKAVFTIIVSEPPENANRVMPVDNRDPGGSWRNHLQLGILNWPRITRNKTGLDSIWGRGGGIPHYTRTDSLLERLEKAPNATWKFEWADGIPRPDLKDGDILVVTAENGEKRKYFISVNDYTPSNNAWLSSITWPDIPDKYSGLFGWKRDTIPGFKSGDTDYRLIVPADVDNIPALVAKTFDVNATVKIQRAKNLWGSKEDRTVTFTVTAEDKISTNSYTIELVKEKQPQHIQPYVAEPFISEFVHTEQFANYFMEICNPGNQPLDLSNYMIARGWGSPADIVESMSNPEDWINRYRKYVPGYKWISEGKWQANPGILTDDFVVDPIVAPGDVFAMGHIRQDQFCNDKRWPWIAPFEWWMPDALDVQFQNFNGTIQKYSNPWGEAVGNSPLFGWSSTICLFKILNDSIKLGLKPANDPNDFLLIDVIGMAVGSMWNWAGMEAGHNRRWIRKPHVSEGNRTIQASFGTNKEDSEWIPKNHFDWKKEDVGWPYEWIFASADIGSHAFDAPTEYISTVTSGVYKVSPGYGMKETIRGIPAGTTVSDFLRNIIKSNDNQYLKIKSHKNGSFLTVDDGLNMNDTLVVISADSTNTTKYLLEVTEQWFLNEAILYSNVYPVWVDSEPKTGEEKNEPGRGTLTGMEYGTMLKTVLKNVYIPSGATLNVINESGAYVPLQQLNLDTTYVYTTVHPNIFLEVIAEDGLTSIIYQIKPESSQKDAFILSDLYSINQIELLVEYIQRGTNVETFRNNLIPVFGATVTIRDVLGNEKTTGKIYQDDKVVVTSADGSVTRVYFLSMLHDRFIQETTYLAYILSDSYEINQENKIINGVSGLTTINEFLTKISPAAGATVIVIDENGNIKITGDIDRTDKVRVTSSDGKITVGYTFGRLTGAGSVTEKQNQISIYPNPTNGEITIEGIQPGGIIQIHKTSGVLVLERKLTRASSTIALKSFSPGYYFVSVFYPSGLNETVKIIKK